MAKMYDFGTDTKNISSGERKDIVKMYDFGADTKKVSFTERKAFAWPVAVWSCYIPENELQDINILEHLLLQLVNKGYKDPKSILCTKIGFNKELVEASLESCSNKKYLSKGSAELTLSEDGKKMLGNYDNPYSSDLEASKKSKKIYLIQDLITKSVIPVFNIEKLPQFYTEDESALVIHYENFTGKKPRSASQKTAMIYWARLCQNRRKGLVGGTNTIDVSQPPEQAEPVEEFIPFEDEVDWESVQEDVRTLADKEAGTERQKRETDIKNLTIMDDSPEVYWARGYIAINRHAPDEVIIISPFGESLDNWFRTVMNRLRTCDSKLDEELQLFLMIKQDELKDKIAFGNDLDIALFDAFPYICNDPEYKVVKDAINRLTVSKTRFQKGENDTSNYLQTLRTAYEASLRLVAKKNPYLFVDKKKLTYKDYTNNLDMLVNSYSFLSDDVYMEYSGLYHNMIKADKGEGYATAFLAMFLMDAWKDKNGKSMELLRDMPELPMKIKERIKLCNIASHGGDKAADLKITGQEALQLYQEFEEIFRAIYNRFMEGR